jgi:hypothetical protein
VRTNESHENIVVLSDIRNERLRALSPYGPVRAGLTTLPTTNEVRLTELLSSLESVVESLNSKSYTALDTLTIAIEGARAALSASTPDTVGTEEGML